MMSNYNITLAEGIQYTTNWRNDHPDTVKAFKISKDEIDQVLAVENAEGMRVYLGKDDEGNPRLVTVAIDANGNDLTNEIFDHCEPCPDNCDAHSPLNSN